MDPYWYLQPMFVRTELFADEQELTIRWWPPRRTCYEYHYKFYVIIPNAAPQEVYSGKYRNFTIAVRSLKNIYGVNNFNNNNPVNFQIVAFNEGFESRPVQFDWPS